MRYAKNTIINTFGYGGVNNRNGTILNINDGKNYTASDINIYDLYIPYSALKENKTKGIFVIIHGRAWFGGKKENNAFLAQIYMNMNLLLQI